MLRRLLKVLILALFSFRQMTKYHAAHMDKKEKGALPPFLRNILFLIANYEARQVIALAVLMPVPVSWA